MTSKVKKGTAKISTVGKVLGNNKGKGPIDRSGEIEKLREPIQAVTPTVTPTVTATPKEVKNVITTPSGATIAVKGPNQQRVGYSRGNIGWQEMISYARSIYHLAYSAVVVGMADPVVKELINLADQVRDGLNKEHITIPGDLVTQLSEAKAGFDDLPPGHPGYKKAVKRLADMARFIDDTKLRAKVESETVAAMTANKTATTK